MVVEFVTDPGYSENAWTRREKLVDLKQGGADLRRGGNPKENCCFGGWNSHRNKIQRKRSSRLFNHVPPTVAEIGTKVQKRKLSILQFQLEVAQGQKINIIHRFMEFGHLGASDN